MDFSLRLKMKESKKDNIPGSYKKAEETVEHENTAISIVVVVLKTVFKGLEKRLGGLEIRGRIETIQNTALLKSVEYLEESRRPEETCFHSDLY